MTVDRIGATAMSPPEVGAIFMGRDRLLVVSAFDAWSGGGNGDVHLDEYGAKGGFRFTIKTLRELSRMKLRRLPGRAYTHEQIESRARMIRATGRARSNQS